MPETRRRGKELETAILAAGWDVLAENGYGGLTFEAVAERAGTGKAALYRRWPDKESLALAVVGQVYLETPQRIPDTGSLREDVLTLLRSTNRRMGAYAPVLFSVMLGTLFDGSAATPAVMRERLLGDRDGAIFQVVRAAVDRGELAEMPSERVMRAPYDLLRQEAIMHVSGVPDADLEEIVDEVFLPAVGLRAS
jgi:AcrR family transcriptional regulator